MELKLTKYEEAAYDAYNLISRKSKREAREALSNYFRSYYEQGYFQGEQDLLSRQKVEGLIQSEDKLGES